MNKLLFCFLLVLPNIVQANSFEVAHLNVQGQNMIVFPVNPNIEFKSSQSRSAIMFALQRCASRAGLAGKVVVMWERSGQTKYVAPQK